MASSEPLNVPDSRLTADYGILLVGHGTRFERGQEQFKQLYGQFRDRWGPIPVRMAFLELAQPDVETAIRELARLGCRHLVVVPLLLFTAGHANTDVPESVENAAAKLGMKVLLQTPSLELAQFVVNASRNCFVGACCAQQLCSAACSGQTCRETMLVMIGRGSSDQAAADKMRHFTALRCIETRVAAQVTAFLHGQNPGVEEALELAAQSPFGRIVLQPHLLFDGRLTHQLQDLVARFSQEYPEKQWELVGPLVHANLADFAGGLADFVASNLESAGLTRLAQATLFTASRDEVSN